MKTPDLSLSDLGSYFPDDFTPEQRAKAQTLFLKELAATVHKFYRGKIVTMPKAGIYGFNWFNVYYTPGVSMVSTTIRDNNDASFDLSNRGNLVAVVSDSTRVLGDGDVTPPGGLGVMEGKAFLMKYLGGVDGVALCIDSYNKEGKHDPDKIIDFVKMVQPSFGAVNLEDISQPNCFKVLDTLREDCDIPVWHDDAQGTASVTLAGLINALRVDRQGAQGRQHRPARRRRRQHAPPPASSSWPAAIPTSMIVFDSKGGLHKGRDDVKADKAFYRKWEICRGHQPEAHRDRGGGPQGRRRPHRRLHAGPGHHQAGLDPLHGAQVHRLRLRQPGARDLPLRRQGSRRLRRGHRPGRLPQPGEQLHRLPRHPQGRPPGAGPQDHRRDGHRRRLRRGRLRREEAGINPDHIMPTMEETEVFAIEAADVAMQAIKDGVARVELTWDEVYDTTLADIKEARGAIDLLQENDFIKKPDIKMLIDARDKAVAAVKK